MPKVKAEKKSRQHQEVKNQGMFVKEELALALAADYQWFTNNRLLKAAFKRLQTHLTALVSTSRRLMAIGSEVVTFVLRK